MFSTGQVLEGYSLLQRVCSWYYRSPSLRRGFQSTSITTRKEMPLSKFPYKTSDSFPVCKGTLLSWMWDTCTIFWWALHLIVFFLWSAFDLTHFKPHIDLISSWPQLFLSLNWRTFQSVFESVSTPTRWKSFPSMTPWLDLTISHQGDPGSQDFKGCQTSRNPAATSSACWKALQPLRFARLGSSLRQRGMVRNSGESEFAVRFYCQMCLPSGLEDPSPCGRAKTKHTIK